MLSVEVSKSIDGSGKEWRNLGSAFTSTCVCPIACALTSVSTQPKPSGRVILLFSTSRIVQTLVLYAWSIA